MLGFTILFRCLLSHSYYHRASCQPSLFLISQIIPGVKFQLCDRDSAINYREFVGRSVHRNFVATGNIKHSVIVSANDYTSLV